MTDCEIYEIPIWTPEDEDLFLPAEQADALYAAFLAFVEEFPAAG